MGILQADTKRAAEQALSVLGYVPVPREALPRGYCNGQDFAWWWNPTTRKAGSVSMIREGWWQAGWFLSSDRESVRMGDAFAAWEKKEPKP